ncbi:ATP-binding protein [Shouchella patagoniensis]|uniref:ATP-binding protein n=1 Tax=Shouchella patagoniensis TaxID=228576 RepID=UPI0009952254|nr:ATP-binding protein [Shouchella patagoniensis]
MGYLEIKKLYYKGDNYYYESPLLKKGLNIIEGENGSGKSTFSNLISYGLGNYVREFDDRERKKHTEIVGDTNNYVYILLNINQTSYKLKRFFNVDVHKIFVDEDGEIQDYLIHRPNSDVTIFSDWLLKKLGIPVIDFFQGTTKSKLNFSDLFRLIYYDQKTVAEKIYKDSRSDGNFVSDSEFMRKVIFQMLTGHEFSEYYKLIGKINNEKRLKNILKAKEEGFIDVASELGFYDLKDSSAEIIKKEIDSKQLQLKRLEIYETALLTPKKEPIDSLNKVKNIKKEMIDAEVEIEGLRERKNRLFKEINNIKNLIENTILEVTHIKKIILTHEELSLFSPDTCPYCLNKVVREESHCICGQKVSENEYEKFFYSTDEYLGILKSKQKSVETLKIAIKSCNEEITDVDSNLQQLNKEKKMKMDLIKEAKKDIDRGTNIVDIKQSVNKKNVLREEIVASEQHYKIKKNYDSIAKQYSLKEETLSDLNREMNERKAAAQEEIKEKVIEFNEIYSSLLMGVQIDIRKAKIDKDNYMPVINEGQYKEASVDVPVRLMYFLTLLKMSIKDDSIPFPRFLLIDTPESLGIDQENLEKAISQFPIEENKFQVILTTGISKYPDEFSLYKKGESLTKQSKLLKKK